MFAFSLKGLLMQVSYKTFFDGLPVDKRYFFNVFKEIGVKNRFFFTDDDLMVIINHLPQNRYKSALVVKRALDLLGAENESSYQTSN